MRRIIGAAIILFSVASAPVAEASLLVWSDFAGSVRTANTDGTNVNVIADNAYGGVAVDNLTGRVYWGSTNSAIRSSNIDGSDQQLVASTGSAVVWNMFVDGGQLYFNSSGNPGSTGVGRVNVNGSGLVRIGDNTAGEGLAFDRDSQKVIYQHFGIGGEPTYTIKTVDANGVGSPALLPNQPNLGFLPGLFVDNVQDKLYYASPSLGIYRSDLDGSSLELVANLPSSGEYSIYVDSPTTRSTTASAARARSAGWTWTGRISRH
jgi:hypothetical protein